MTIHDIGFAPDEIANYMRLLLQGDSAQAERMRILKQRRARRWMKFTFRNGGWTVWTIFAIKFRKNLRKALDLKFTSSCKIN